MWTDEIHRGFDVCAYVQVDYSCDDTLDILLEIMDTTSRPQINGKLDARYRKVIADSSK